MMKAYKTTVAWNDGGENEFEETIYIFAETRGAAKVYAAKCLEIPFTEVRITRAPKKDYMPTKYPFLCGVLDGDMQEAIDRYNRDY